MEDKSKYEVVFCPRCGRRYPIRIYHNGTPITYNIKCSSCKQTSEVVVGEKK